jgi:uncharacterized repeat protein (TIGR01451 family)
VNTVPDMALAMHHIGNFGKGQTGVYTITALNGGGGPTSGTVSLVDTLPSGLSAAAISGNGWNCNVNTVTCTRADTLAAGGSYPPITLTVNVSTVISSSVTNIATIAGGGETDTGNDMVGDVTDIVSAGIDLGAAITPSQLFTSQGATGVTFAVSVVNGGSIPSSGIVSLTTALPSGLTAMGISGTGWACTLANLTCTRNDSLGSSLSFPDITVTFSVALNAPLNVESVSASVSGGGDANTSNNTSAATVEINPFLSIFSNTGSVTVAAGQPAKYQVGVAATAAAGTVAFTCSGLPTSASCSFNPPSLNNGSVFIIMTVSTTPRAVGAIIQHLDNPNPWLSLGLLSVVAMLALIFKLCVEPALRKRWVPVLGMFVLLATAVLSGCAGGGGSTKTGTNTVAGTPAGTYAITFTATSPNGAVTRTMDLLVQ